MRRPMPNYTAWAVSMARLFDVIWVRMAAAGVVDDAGGAEWQRRYVEWVLAGRPRPIRLWIEEEVRREATH